MHVRDRADAIHRKAGLSQAGTLFGGANLGMSAGPRLVRNPENRIAGHSRA